MTGDDSTSTVAPFDGEQGEGSVTFDHDKARRGAKLLLEAMGEDPDRPGLQETWERHVPGVFETFSAGRRVAEKPTLRTFSTTANDLVIKTGISLYSLCEHHLLPYHGEVHLAYRPRGQVVGLSKLPRYVRWQACRPTMQEELTQRIAAGLESELDAGAVLVEATATHMCEAMRGVEQATRTTTAARAGDPTDREERRFRAAVAESGGYDER